MVWFSNLKLTTKFNIIIAVVLLALFVFAAYFNYRRQQSLIIKGAVDNARIIAQQIIETRDYMSSVIRDEPERNYALVPQVVATQVAKRITRGSPFYVRQISLRYRNPENRPDSYETAQLEKFARKSVGEEYRVVSVNGRQELRYLLPMMAEKSCLECHGAFAAAPLFVQRRFPPGHYSYNYKLGEVIGAVSVSVPMAKLYHEIGLNLKVDLLYRGVMFLTVIVILNILIHRTILNPVKTIAETMTEVAKTGSFARRIPRTGDDEIGQLSGAFNDMMEELQRKTLQRLESEDRYRNFIEMAQSPVITFLEDGKIVIANQRAEKLFGLVKNELLGETIFSFLEDGVAVQQGIAEYLRDGKGGGVGATTRHRVRDVGGKLTEVDLVLSASKADHQAMFTAILRLTSPPKGESA